MGRLAKAAAAGLAAWLGASPWPGREASGQGLPPLPPDPTRASAGAGEALPPLPTLPDPTAAPVPPGGDPPATTGVAPPGPPPAGLPPVGTRVPTGVSRTFPGFPARLFNAYFGAEENEEESGTLSQRRGVGVESPITNVPPFPFSEHLGPSIGVPPDRAVFPLMEAINNGPSGGGFLKDNWIRVYGWADPSVTFGTSRNSNIPLSYAIVPNSLQLSQAIVIFERQPDTAQTDHSDWGFKVTNLYGIDYRYTTAKGWFSDQLLKHNHLYGWDPLQLYVDVYVPTIGQGTVFRLGRYISPIDIEAQLSPENYLYSHSVMYTYDPYTFTGLQGITKLDDQWTLQLGVHAGNDMAPWTTSSQANGEILLKWVSKDNKDALFGGVDSIGHGYFKNGHDDLQVAALTWTPRLQRQVPHDHRVVLHLAAERPDRRDGDRRPPPPVLHGGRARQAHPGAVRLVRDRELHGVRGEQEGHDRPAERLPRRLPG